MKKISSWFSKRKKRYLSAVLKRKQEVKEEEEIWDKIKHYPGVNRKELFFYLRKGFPIKTLIEYFKLKKEWAETKKFQDNKRYRTKEAIFLEMRAAELMKKGASKAYSFAKKLFERGEIEEKVLESARKESEKWGKRLHEYKKIISRLI